MCTVEAAAQAALDTADWLIDVLDRLDGDTEREDGGDAEPSLGAPNGHANHVVWLRGSDRERSHQEIAQASVRTPVIKTP